MHESVRRVVSYLVEHAPLLTEHGLALVTAQLVACVTLAALPPQAFAALAARAAATGCPVLLQLLRGLHRCCGPALVASARLYEAVLAVAQAPGTAPEAAALCLSWLWHDDPPRACVRARVEGVEARNYKEETPCWVCAGCRH